MLEDTREKKASPYPQPQLQSGSTRPSQKIQAPPLTPTPTPRELVSTAAPSKKQEDLRSLDSSQKKVGFQLGSSEPSPKRVKAEKTNPASGSGGKVRTTPRPRPAKPKALVREDLNEEFWSKLAREEAQRKRIYPHQVVQSPWQKGDVTGSSGKFNFTRPANQGNQQHSTGTSTVKTTKRKLYSKTSQGPEEF